MSSGDYIRVEGTIHSWNLTAEEENARRFFMVVLPFGEASRAFKAYIYDDRKGTGEQRSEIESHVKALKKSMAADTYTPTPVSVGVYPRHFQDRQEKDGFVAFAVEEKDPLPLTDGQQRFAALKRMKEEAVADGDTGLAARIDGLPIVATVHLGGDTQRDFINLQLGKNIDGALLRSLKVRQEMFPVKTREAVKLAHAIARSLQEDNLSPFAKTVRFDTRGCYPLPVTTVAPTGSSDLSTSLVGLAKVALETGLLKCDAKRLASLVVDCVQTLRKQSPELLADGMLLCPPPEGGKGSSTLLVGLGVCMAHRLAATGRSKVEDGDREALVHAAKAAFDGMVEGNMSAQFKRQLMGKFASEFFGDLEVEMHQNVPLDLVHTLSGPAFDASPLPKRKAAPRGRSKSDKARPTARSSSEEDRGNPVWGQVVEELGDLRDAIALGGSANGGVIHAGDMVPAMLDPGVSYVSKATLDKFGKGKLKQINGGDKVATFDPDPTTPMPWDESS